MTTITVYQVIVAAASLGIIIGRTIRFFQRETAQSVFKYVAVVCIWGGIGAISLFPQIAHFIRIKFGFGENFNTMIFIAFVILFVLFFRLLSIVEHIERTITQLIRKEALEDVPKGRKRK